ncbi:MAG TPA: Branched-chain-amino-acid aminotransferase [Hyphomicrobiaceae bacterium MAG_BT-2024]
MSDVLPYDNRDGFIWFNGNLVPWREAKIHILCHGLHYSSAVFEGERAYNGVVYKMAEHSQRLIDGAKELDFKIPYTVEEINQATQQVVAANSLSNCYIRPISWRGSDTMGVSARKSTVNLAIAAWQWDSYFSMEERLKGIRVCWAKYRRPDPMTAPTKTKATGLYMIGTVEKNRAEKQGCSEALMLDWRGRVAECTSGNIFFVSGQELHSPIPDCFLDGITRRTIIKLAMRRGYRCVDRVIMPEELKDFNECFMVGTAAEVTSIKEIGQYTFKPSYITENMLRDYTLEVCPGKTESSEKHMSL